jgi:hypothetical protein
VAEFGVELRRVSGMQVHVLGADREEERSGFDVDPAVPLKFGCRA